MIVLVLLLFIAPLLVVVVVNNWLTVRYPSVWWRLAKARVGIHSVRQKLKQRHLIARLTREAGRLHHELFESISRMDEHK
jgi:RNase P protein component